MSTPKLLTASAWKKATFAAGSEPTNNTIRIWVDEGVVKGCYTDRNTYVYEGEVPGSNLTGDVDDIVHDLVSLSA